ncbi:MAG: LOG family protein, partial [candidate division NC10 bacterium]|nr:LOG family protein [candidate division NC10 bacterium]
VNIRLPFEQRPNPVIQGDEKLVQFKYFFTRKLIFAKETDAIALFPGGFGTLDEAFEILTLAQTGKGQPLPIVFVDAPAGGYWREWEGFVRRQMLDRGMITPQDTALFRITDRVEEAVEEVAGFYRNYHSSRYVQDGRLVIRHLSPIPDEALAHLNAEFADIVVDGRIERNGPHPDETNEPELADLPRLIFRFNRRDFGRLRRLIDAVNAAAAGPPAGPPRPVARRDGDRLSHA